MLLLLSTYRCAGSTPNRRCPLPLISTFLSASLTPPKLDLGAPDPAPPLPPLLPRPTSISPALSPWGTLDPPPGAPDPSRRCCLRSPWSHYAVCRSDLPRRGQASLGFVVPTTTFLVGRSAFRIWKEITKTIGANFVDKLEANAETKFQQEAPPVVIASKSWKDRAVENPYSARQNSKSIQKRLGGKARTQVKAVWGKETVNKIWEEINQK
uniref:Uncharacterized protein n=1 Tax=Oryza rufipogon TaxID=4529 RepID=A0A0E0QYI2_ORYRU